MYPDPKTQPYTLKEISLGKQADHIIDMLLLQRRANARVEE